VQKTVKVGATGLAVELWSGSEHIVRIVSWGYNGDDECAVVARLDGGEIVRKADNMSADGLYGTPRYSGGVRVHVYSALLLRVHEGPVDYRLVDEGGVV